MWDESYRPHRRTCSLICEILSSTICFVKRRSFCTSVLQYLLGRFGVLKTAAVLSSVSVIETSQLMLYKEIIAVCSQIHTKHINTLCGQNVELLNIKLAVHMVTTGL